MQSEPGVTARFHYEAVLNGAKSREAGRPVYEDRVYVEILVAGMSKQTVNRPITDKDKRRFPLEWAAFENGEESKRSGTPLGMWPRLSGQPAMVAMLEAQNVFTVEDVASLPDGRIGVLGMGGYKLRKDALDFLAGSAIQARDDRTEALEAENAALKARLAAIEERLSVPPPRKKPGPKPKQAVQ